MDDMNEYERERLEQIAANNALLAKLGLTGEDNVVRASIRAATKPARASPSSRRSTPKRKREDETEEPSVRRRSTRLMGLEADHVKVAEIAQQEQERFEEQRKIARKIRAPKMKIGEMLDDEKSLLGSQTELASETTLQALAISKTPRPIIPTSSGGTGLAAGLDKRQQANEDKRLQEQFKNLELRASKKITQERIYSMAVHPDPAKTVIFVGDKRGQLGIWDADAQQTEQADADGEVEAQEDVKQPTGSIWRMQLHASSSISCLKIDPADGQSLFSSSYDCSFRRLAFDASQESTEVYALEDENALINHFDLTIDAKEAWLVDSSGGLSHVDMRERKGTARRRWEISGATSSSARKLGGVSINPIMPWLLATAGNDRCVRIWDNRYFSKIRMEPYTVINPVDTDDDPLAMKSEPDINCTRPQYEADYEHFHRSLKLKNMAPLARAEYMHGKSCSSAYWDNWGSRLLTTSYDDKLRVFEFDSQTLNTEEPIAAGIKEARAIRHDCQSGRWVTVLKAQWSLNTEYAAHFSIGNMKRKITIYSASGSLLADLGNRDVVTAVPAVTASHPSHINRVFGGNASGKCQYWAPQT